MIDDVERGPFATWIAWIDAHPEGWGSVAEDERQLRIFGAEQDALLAASRAEIRLLREALEGWLAAYDDGEASHAEDVYFLSRAALADTGKEGE